MKTTSFLVGIMIATFGTKQLISAQENSDAEKLAAVAARPFSNDSPIGITFHDLKFEMPKDAEFDRKMLGEKIESLVGKTVKLSGGEILPTSVFQREGIQSFILVSEVKKCGLYTQLLGHIVKVEMASEQTTSFTTQRLVVEGEFSIKEWHVIDGRPSAVFHLKATSIAPLDGERAKK